MTLDNFLQCGSRVLKTNAFLDSSKTDNFWVIIAGVWWYDVGASDTIRYLPVKGLSKYGSEKHVHSYLRTQYPNCLPSNGFWLLISWLVILSVTLDTDLLNLEPILFKTNHPKGWNNYVKLNTIPLDRCRKSILFSGL